MLSRGPATTSVASTKQPKRGRRGAGEGSIFRRADGRWCAQIDLGFADGKRQRKLVYGSTRRAVQDKLDELRMQRKQGVPLNSHKDTLGAFLDRWYASLKPRPHGRYSPTTLKGYGDAIRLHLKPRLGHVRVADLNADHVQLLQDGMLATGLASQTVLNARNILRSALRQAMRQRMLTYNPVELVDAPLASRGTGRAIEHDETPRFLIAIKGHRLEAAFLMELALGCRRSEVLGLEWEAVDLRPGHERIHIRQGLHRVRGRGLLMLEPKSERGNRTLALPQRLVALLRARQEAQNDEQLHAAEHWSNTRPDGTERLVFTTLKGTPIEPGHFTNHLKAALRSAGLGHLRGHDLRHSASSILQARGLPPLAAMEVLGHASPDVTMGIYGHMFSSSRRQAAELMDRYLDEVSEDAVATGIA
jgi:integrase